MKKNILLLSCLFLWFLPIANFRLIDGDEGYYLFAAKLLLDGKTIYKDFFYPQTPLLPYIYKWWFSITGISWINARLLHAIVTALIGFILFKNLLRINKKVATLGLFLFLFSGYITGWFTIAKAYAMPVLLILLACEFMQSKIFSKHFINILFVGILLGLAINIRLYMIVLVPIFYIYSVKRFISHKTLNANINISREASFLPVSNRWIRNCTFA